MTLIKCPNCGKNMNDKSRFCPHCGAQSDAKIEDEIKKEEDSTCYSEEHNSIDVDKEYILNKKILKNTNNNREKSFCINMGKILGKIVLILGTIGCLFFLIGSFGAEKDGGYLFAFAISVELITCIIAFILFGISEIIQLLTEIRNK